MTSSVEPDYLTDASGLHGQAERLFIPSTEAGVCQLMADAASLDMPVTIAGAGTGVAGGRVPRSGWLISTENLCTLEVHTGFARVGAGVLLKDLQHEAARTGQFYPPDPTENWSSLGGNISTNASGSRSFKYGATRRWVESLRVVMADGSLREFARGDKVDFDVPALRRPATTKHTAGYLLAPGMDWIDLFVGADGTLGVVTEAVVRLLPVPRELITGVVFFRADEECLRAVEAWRGSGGLRMIEFFDAHSLDFLRGRYPEVPRRAVAALLIEQESVGDADWDMWTDRLETSGALEDSWFASSEGDRERFRKFRHALPEIVNAEVRSRGCLKMSTDFAVPIARNREMLALYRTRLEEEFPAAHVIFGHIGDAHLHVNILPSGEEESHRAIALMTEFARGAAALGGTVSAEHGLGKRKAHYLELMYSPEEIALMRSVKARLDPGWRLGRGTLFEGMH